MENISFRVKFVTVIALSEKYRGIALALEALI